MFIRYRSLVRASVKDPRAVEAEADDLDSKRLYICRQYSNYIAHVPDPGFIAPTEKMLKFLQTKITSMKSKGDIAKKHLKKPDACILLPTDHVSDAIVLFSKLKCNSLLVKEDSGWYQLSIYDILGVGEVTKVAALKTKSISPYFCKPLDPYSSLDFSKPGICTDDGAKTGKLMGQIWAS